MDDQPPTAPIQDRRAEVSRSLGRSDSPQAAVGRRPMTPTPSQSALVAEAERRGLRVTALGWRSAYAIHGPRHSARLYGAISDRTSHLAVLLAGDKQATKSLLHQRGLPTPSWSLNQSWDDALAAFDRVGAPVAVKPNTGAQGLGVRTNIADTANLHSAYVSAAKYDPQVLIERQCFGVDLRFLVVDGKVVSVSRRAAPEVVGDGVNTVRSLINQLNADPRRGLGHQRPLTRVDVDEDVLAQISRQGLALDAVPNRSVHVILRSTASISRGGAAIDCTDEVHPSLSALAVRAAQLIGLDIAGVDMIVERPDDDSERSGAMILEVNASPGLRLHLLPATGLGRNVAAAIFDYLFPDTRS